MIDHSQYGEPMHEPERTNVHTVWVGGQLSLMERLTLELYLRRNLSPVLWTYDEIRAPRGVEIRNAAEILPRDSLFSFQSPRGFSPGLGKGSFSHWSDLFQLAVLYKLGGWYSQLDVSCLLLPDAAEYYFFPFRFPGSESLGLQTCVMKCPRGAAVLSEAFAAARSVSNPQTATTMDWFDSMRAINDCVLRHGLGRFIADPKSVVDFGGPEYMLATQRPPVGITFLHWSNAWSHQFKNNPLPGSLYQELLESCQIDPAECLPAKAETSSF